MTMSQSAVTSHSMKSGGELQQHVEQFARSLGILGVQPGDNLATLMDPGHELNVVRSASQQLGLTCTELDPLLGADELQKVLQTQSSKFVVSASSYRKKLIPPGIIPNDAAVPVVVSDGDAFGYDFSMKEMVNALGQFSV